MPSTNTYSGKIFFVSGLAGGREAFLGKAIDEPYEGQITLEGKAVGFTPYGYFTVRPFTTLVNFRTHDPNQPVQQVSNQEAFQEARSVLETSVTQISRANYPLLYRWFEGCVRTTGAGAFPFGAGFPDAGRPNGAHAYGYFQNNPFFSFYEGFVSSAEQFRRALFQAPQVTSTRELDKLTELEGSLTIEIGKITNQIATRFNQLVARENELGRYFENFTGFGFFATSTHHVGGWVFLMNRLQIAKHWARRNGNTQMVREINAFVREGIQNLNEVILEHASTLDTLIAETFSQYGIVSEIYGEMSPFMGYSHPLAPVYEGQVWDNTPVSRTSTTPNTVGSF